MSETVDRRVRLPDGNTVTVRVPQSWGADEIRGALQERGAWPEPQQSTPPSNQLGRVTAQSESGGQGVHAVSDAIGGRDPGGVSYGAHQLSSSRGTMSAFLQSPEGQDFAPQFEGLEPGTPQFDDTYRRVAEAAGEEFEQAQFQFLVRSHFQPQAERLQAKGVNVAERSPGLQELLFSTGVQYGGGSRVIENALKGKEVSEMSDEEIIDVVTQYKIENVDTHFRSLRENSGREWSRMRESLVGRFERERDEFVRMATTGDLAPGRTASTQPPREEPTKPVSEMTFREKIDYYGSDILEGAHRGMVNAVDNMFQTVGDVFAGPAEQRRQMLEENPDLPLRVGAIDRTMEWVGNQLRKARVPDIADIRPRSEEADTVAGSISEGLAQFLTGYQAMRLGTAGVQPTTRAGQYGLALARGAGSDIAAFDPNDPMFVDFLDELGVPVGTVQDWVNDPDRPDYQRRLYRALEGAGLGVLTDQMMRMMGRGVRYARKKKLERSLAKEAENAPPRVMPDDEVEAARETVRTARGEEIRRGSMGEPIRARRDPDRAAPERAGNINLTRWDSSRSAKEFMEEQAKRFAKAPERVSHEQTRAIARELDMTQGDLKRLGRDMKDIQARVFAAREYLNTSSEQIVEMARRLDPNDGNQLADLYEMMVRHSAVYDEVRGVTAQSGRLLNQFRMMAGQDEARVKFVRDIMDNSELRHKLPELVDQLNTLPAKHRNRLIKQAVNNPNQWDAIVETYINSLLTGPQTHIVNMLSTEAATLWSVGERYAAAGIGKLRGNPDRITLGEANAYAFGHVQAGRDAMRALARTLKTGDPHIYKDGTSFIDPIGKIEVDRHRSFSREGLGYGLDPITRRMPASVREKTGSLVDAVGEYGVRMPGRFILAEDAFMKSINYRMQLNALAYRDVNRQVAAGKIKREDMGQRIRELIEAPPQELHSQALDHARYITFTKPLGETGRHIQATLGHPAAKIAFPFVRTPINIFKYSVERTPAGVLTPNFWQNVRKGGAEADLQMAKVAVGSSLMATVAMWAGEGYFTGAPPNDPATRRAYYDTGRQPYSFVDKDGWFGEPGKHYSYFRFEPMGTLFGVAADYAAIRGHMDDEEADEIAAMMAMSVAQNFVNKTYMQNLAELIDLFEDPGQNGMRYLQRMVSGAAVPTGVAQYTRTQDPYLRRAETMLEAIKARAPGWSDQVAPHVNVWGQEVLLEGGVGPDIASPIWVSSKHENQFIHDLWDNEIIVDMPNRTIRMKDVDFLEELGLPNELRHVLDDIELEGWDYNRYVKMAGEPAYRTLSNMAENTQWKNAPRWQKEIMVREVVSKYRNAATRQIVLEHLRERRGELQQMLRGD